MQDTTFSGNQFEKLKTSQQFDEKNALITDFEWHNNISALANSYASTITALPFDEFGTTTAEPPFEALVPSTTSFPFPSLTSSMTTPSLFGCADVHSPATTSSATNTGISLALPSTSNIKKENSKNLQEKEVKPRKRGRPPKVNPQPFSENLYKDFLNDLQSKSNITTTNSMNLQEKDVKPKKRGRPPKAKPQAFTEDVYKDFLNDLQSKSNFPDIKSLQEIEVKPKKRRLDTLANSNGSATTSLPFGGTGPTSTAPSFEALVPSLTSLIYPSLTSLMTASSSLEFGGLGSTATTTSSTSTGSSLAFANSIASTTTAVPLFDGFGTTTSKSPFKALPSSSTSYSLTNSIPAPPLFGRGCVSSTATTSTGSSSASTGSSLVQEPSRPGGTSFHDHYTQQLKNLQRNLENFLQKRECRLEKEIEHTKHMRRLMRNASIPNPIPTAADFRSDFLDVPTDFQARLDLPGRHYGNLKQARLFRRGRLGQDLSNPLPNNAIDLDFLNVPENYDPTSSDDDLKILDVPPKCIPVITIDDDDSGLDSLDTSESSTADSNSLEFAAEANQGNRKEGKKELPESYKFLLSVEELNLVRNVANFTCPICFGDFESNEGVVLHECHHAFCEDCLAKTIEHAEDVLIKCPFTDDTYTCSSYIQQREIKALVSKEIYEKYLHRSITTAESGTANSFHCKTPDCPGWCVFEDDVTVFNCPVCFHSNCLTCSAIHRGLNCREYQDRLQDSKLSDPNSQKTLNFLDKMIKEGKAMKCPKCMLTLMKASGCDAIRCTMCQTEICWATKGPRWGPRGYGDTSGGCRCNMGLGKKCHRSCMGCH